MFRFVCVIFLTLWVVPLWAETSADNLRKAQETLKSLDYPSVIAFSESVIRNPHATKEDRLQAFALQAYALIILGDAVSAEENFLALLKGKPEFKLPANMSSKIQQVFSKVSLAFQEQQKRLFQKQLDAIRKNIRLVDETTTEIIGGESLTFRFSLEDPNNDVAKIMLAYRKGPQQKYAPLQVRHNERTDKWEASLPGSWTENEEGLEVEYFLSSRDTRGYIMRDLYSIEDPNFLLVKPEPVVQNQPFYKRYWFWGAIGGFAGASVLTYVLLKQEAQKCLMPPCIDGE